ncbi:trimethylamine methyltransferase family protein [Roseovarius sp. EL26]|uniref:trimethylamine methyltransferase family protein n=1 Tax=Roseovarius sp. EL26 TaxID=2126672 RepID=UPI0020B1067D|nr:trimethylamine methyltransferase family protein [Roseovarius sp. EL26]
MEHKMRSDKGVQKRSSRRGGRASRVSAEASNSVQFTAAELQHRSIPAYGFLAEKQLQALEAQADWILSEIGVEFRGDDVALALFRDVGATVKDQRVCFEPGHARELCSTALRSYKLHARDPRHSVTLGGDNIVLMPGYGSPFVTDLDKGRRYATLEDFQNFVKMTYASPWLHHSGGTVCEPVDVPVNKRHLDMVYAHLRYSAKPFMGSVTSPERAQDSIEMARLVFGRDFMEKNAVIQANINVNSPLVFDDTMSGALRVYAEANQCVAVSPAIFGGAMGPVSQAAVTAQTLAEGMVGIALTQLVRKGCPTVLGSFHSTMNLKSGALTFGTPEANLSTMALSQLVRRLGIPVRSGGGQITSSNAADGQAMQDSASAMWATMISGAHQVWHAAGWLEGGLTMSYEKFVMDLDHCGMMMQMLHGFPVNDETLARDSYLEAGPGENFLSTSHTMRNFASANYQSEIPDTGPYETWAENGELSAAQRANSRWKELLAEYEMPQMDGSIDEALIDFMARRKASMPDEWY